MAIVGENQKRVSNQGRILAVGLWILSDGKKRNFIFLENPDCKYHGRAFKWRG
jgi:hypothetical protein